MGLRPSDDSGSHLFKVIEIKKLIKNLKNLSKKISKDTAAFARWIAAQNPAHLFNIGCIFAFDVDGDLRVCLHPKVVPSRFEKSPLPEAHMEGADFITLITLYPADKQYFSITIQPLICSDVLSLGTDRSGDGPMEAVNRSAGCFGDQPPDHVDVVSVATCTPQPEGKTRDGVIYREWHEQFQNSFKGAAQNPNFARHHSRLSFCRIIGRLDQDWQAVFRAYSYLFPRNMNASMTTYPSPVGDGQRTRNGTIIGRDPMTTRWQPGTVEGSSQGRTHSRNRSTRM